MDTDHGAPHLPTGWISVDFPDSWPAHVQDHVMTAAHVLEGSTEYTSDLRIAPEESEKFGAILGTTPVLAYHCTRLLAHESEWIAEGGMRPLDETLVTDRIRAAAEEGLLSDDDVAILLNENVFAKGEAEYRRGRTCFFLSRRVLEEEVAGVWKPLAIWGGEAIWKLSPEAQIRLRHFGVPTVVVAGLLLHGFGERYDAWPGLLHAFVGRILGLDNADADVHYYEPTPADRVAALWQPGDTEYDRHSEIAPDLIDGYLG